jgi:hypothetical protein
VSLLAEQTGTEAAVVLCDQCQGALGVSGAEGELRLVE